VASMEEAVIAARKLGQLDRGVVRQKSRGALLSNAWRGTT
jgi:hypothetical protein